MAYNEGITLILRPETMISFPPSVNNIRIRSQIAWLALVFLIYGCANIVPPEGGKKDETPPELLSATPADSSLNIKPSKIELYFNEYMEVRDLEKNLSLSPLLSIPPTILSYGKRVVIKLQDTQLTNNTTYRIGLGNALVDNHEGNPYKDFVYQFSTGSYFDSLELQGQVIDAATGTPDSAALMVLYAAQEDDTAIIRKKPVYAVKADVSGNFIFRSLPLKPFRIYAIRDANSNYMYEPGEEKIGFIDQTVIPALGNDSLYRFYTFKEVRDTVVDNPADTGVVDRSNKPTLSGRNKSDAPSKNKVGYHVNVDTSNTAQRSFELTEQLTIDLFTQLQRLDTAKVYLSYENNGIEVEAVQQLHADSSTISISTQWQPDKVYTLRLVKGWARDSAGAELPPGKYFFRTKREEDYGKLAVHIDKRFSGDGFVLYIYKGTDSIYQKPLGDSIITLSRLQPGDYNMRVIADSNRNGKWDAGNLLLRKQPERVYPYTTTIVIKAGWDNEIDFNPGESDKGLGRKGDKPKMGNRPDNPGAEDKTKEKE